MTNPTSRMICRRLLQAAEADALDSIRDAPSRAGPGANHRTEASFSAAVSGPFDFSMAMTILILLIVLFFLAFFYVYLRRLSADAEDSSAFRQRHPPSNRRGGLDSSAISSLPLVSHSSAAKPPMIDDCPICLSEFRERETVKLIPYCGHVFHSSCLDTWLETHVTCPMCRSAQLFKSPDEVSSDVMHDKDGEQWTAASGDAWRDEGSGGGTRTCTCSSLGHAVVGQRSTSF